MKIATVSDVHGMWNQIVYPKADVLIFAGDILKNYHDSVSIDAHIQLEELERLNDFTADLLARGLYSHIIFVAGNHDWAFERLPTEAQLHVGCPYLEDRLQHLLQLKLHIFGHIHFSYGKTMRKKLFL